MLKDTGTVNYQAGQYSLPKEEETQKLQSFSQTLQRRREWKNYIQVEASEIEFWQVTQKESHRIVSTAMVGNRTIMQEIHTYRHLD
jgi:hypothetical protein